MGPTEEQETVILRDARPEETDDVAELLEASYAEYARVFPAAIWSTYRQEITAVRSRLGVAELIVAVASRQLVGTVTFYPDGGADEHGWPSGFASLRLLAVTPAARDHGVGRRLAEECVARAERRGASWLGLHTAPFMNAATRLYRTMGFVRAPEHDFDPHEHYAAGAAANGSAAENVRGLAYVLTLPTPGRPVPPA